MQLIHQDDTLASDVRIADGFFEKRIGLMGKRPLTAQEALVFRFAESGQRHIHTFFVRATIDVVWVERERVTAIETMRPWRVGTRAKADTVIELAAGGASDVAVGDVVQIDGH